MMITDGREHEGLKSLRAMLVDHPASEFASRLSPSELALVYGARSVISDVLWNFGTDASFDFALIGEHEARIAHHLGAFILAAAPEGSVEVSAAPPWTAFGEAIHAYCAAVAHMETLLLSPQEKNL